MEETEAVKEDENEAKHRRRMELIAYVCGVLIFIACGAVEIFIKPVPPYLYALGLVVSGKHEQLAGMFIKK